MGQYQACLLKPPHSVSTVESRGRMKLLTESKVPRCILPSSRLAISHSCSAITPAWQSLPLSPTAFACSLHFTRLSVRELGFPEFSLDLSIIQLYPTGLPPCLPLQPCKPAMSSLHVLSKACMHATTPRKGLKWFPQALVSVYKGLEFFHGLVSFLCNMFLCSYSHLKKLKDASLGKCEAKILCWLSRGGI